MLTYVISYKLLTSFTSYVNRMCCVDMAGFEPATLSV